MPKISPIKAKKLIKIFLKLGFYVHHQTGSHVHIRHDIKTHIRITIPRHDRFDLPIGVLISILKQAEITKDELIKYL